MFWIILSSILWSPRGFGFLLSPGFWCHPKNAGPQPGLWRVSALFLSKDCVILVLSLGCLIHVDLVSHMVWCRDQPFHSHVCSFVLGPCTEETLLSPLKYSMISAWNSSWGMRGFILGSQLTCLCLHTRQRHPLLINMQLCSESRC